MATFQIKTYISAVDNITGPLADINKSIKNFMKPVRDLYNSTQKLKKELGFPQVAKSLRGVSKAYSGVASEIKSLGTQMAMVTGAATAAVSALAWRTSSVGDAAAKTAQKVGISTQAWTELAHAGSMSGVAASTLQGGLTRLNKNISEAARGGKKASGMFDYLGISIQDEAGNLKTADAVMAEAADRLNMIEDGAHRSAIAAELFGRSAGPEMLPLLKDGTSGIDALRQEAAELGITFNDMEGKQAEVFGDAMERITAALDGVVFTIGKQLLPPLTEVADKIKAWIVANRELIGVKVGEWIQRLTDYLPTLEMKIKSIWEGVSNFAVKVDGLVQSLGGWEEVLPYIVGGIAAIKLAPLALSVVTLTKAVAGFGWALSGVLVKGIGLVVIGLKGLFSLMLANPITIAIAAIVASFIYLWQNCESFRNFWIAMWDEATGYFSGVIDRISAAFDRGFVDGILQILYDFNPLVMIEAAMEAVFEYFTGISLRDIGAGIIDGFLSGMMGAWEGVTGWLSSAVDGLVNWMPDFVKNGLGISIPTVPVPATPGASNVAPVPVEQSPALQAAQQHAELRRVSVQADARLSFEAQNVPPGVRIDARGWTDQRVGYQAPLMQNPYNGTRMGGLQ